MLIFILHTQFYDVMIINSNFDAFIFLYFVIIIYSLKKIISLYKKKRRNDWLVYLTYSPCIYLFHSLTISFIPLVFCQIIECAVLSKIMSICDARTIRVRWNSKPNCGKSTTWSLKRLFPRCRIFHFFNNTVAVIEYPLFRWLVY